MRDAIRAECVCVQTTLHTPGPILIDSQKTQIVITVLNSFNRHSDSHFYSFLFPIKITPGALFVTDFYFKNAERILKIVGVCQAICKLLYQKPYVICRARVNVLQRVAFKQNRAFNYRSCRLVNRVLAQFRKSRHEEL